MTTPTWLRMSWAQRLDVAARNVRRMFRTGAQMTITGIALSDVGPINGFELDWVHGAGFFVGGCVVWVLTTLAAPPKD